MAAKGGNLDDVVRGGTEGNRSDQKCWDWSYPLYTACGGTSEL